MVSGLEAVTLTMVTAKAEMLIRKPVAEVFEFPKGLEERS